MSQQRQRHCARDHRQQFSTATALLAAVEQRKATAQSMYEYHETKAAHLRWQMRAVENTIVAPQRQQFTSNDAVEGSS